LWALADKVDMRTDPLSIALFLAALRAARGWSIDYVLREPLELPGAYRPLVRA
jgi:hypothetical protein